MLNKDILKKIKEKEKEQQHKIALTRRSLVAQGIISGGGIVVAPSILSLMSNKAYGLECGDAAADNAVRMAGVITVDCGGGALFAGRDIVVGKQAGQEAFIATNGLDNNMGVPADKAPQSGNITQELGIMMNAESPLLAGIRNKSSQATRDLVNGVIVCGRSDNDTQNNEFNIGYWLRAAGLNGSLTGLIGTSDRASGGRSEPVASSVNPAFRPARVRNYSQAQALVDQGKLEDLLPGQADKILTATQNMSKAQLGKFLDADFPTQVKTLVECGYVKAGQLLTGLGPDEINPDPQGNSSIAPAMQAVAQMNNDDPIGRGFNDGIDFEQVASVASLVIRGYAAAGTIEVGGCDYHGDDASQQFNKNYEIGQVIGAIFEMAATLQDGGVPIVVNVISDGSVGNANNMQNNGPGAGYRRPGSDRENTGSSLLFVFNPGGRIETIGGNQIGSFNDSGEIDESPGGTNLTGKSPARMAQVALLNYLAIEGKQDMFKQIVGTSLLGDSEDLFIKFNPRV